MNAITHQNGDSTRSRLCQQHAPSELDQFMFAITHDMKAGLRALAELPSWTEADLRADGYDIPQHIEEHLTMMQSSARDMTTLLDGLTEMARATHLPNDPMQITFGQMARQIWDSIPDTDGFHLNTDSATHRVLLPHEAMERLLHALLDNARRHHDGLNGRIRLTTQERLGQVRLLLEDDGPGIPPASREKVFSPLYMLRRREETGRAGLGLTLARKLVLQVHSEITIEDSGSDRGCTVLVVLPEALSA